MPVEVLLSESSTNSELDGSGESPLVKLERIAYTWSFSRYKMWKECNERYIFEYVMGRKIAQPQRPFFQGSVAHKLIEEARTLSIDAKTKPEDFADVCVGHLPSVFGKYSPKIDWKPGEIDLAFQEAEAIARNYAHLIVENSLLTGDVQCEYTIGTDEEPCVLPNGLHLKGFIDWLKFLPDEGIILDAKSSKSMTWLDKDQLIFYAIAAEHVFKVPVRRVAWLMLRHGKTIWYDITEADKERLTAELLEASRQVLATNFNVNPGSQCGGCPYTHMCNPYSSWILNSGERMEVGWD